MTRRTAEEIRKTDLGNGQRLAVRLAGKAVYCESAKRWFVYDGTRWNGEQQGMVMEYAKASVLALYQDIGDLEEFADRKTLIKHAVASESERALRAAVSLAKSTPELQITPERFDQDAMLLNVTNGTIDLRTGELRAHSADDCISKLAPVAYDREATCPRFGAFLQEIFSGDEERVGYVQKVLGYCLTGVTNERAVFIAFGSGRNGKSTLSRLLMTLLGDYARRTPTETIMAKRNDGGIPNDLAALVGARFVTVSETEEGRRLNVSKVKDMSGDEPMTARFLHGEFFSFRPSFKLWISTNHKPVLPGSDRAIWDRFRLLPFDVRIPDERMDKELEAKLEGELPGILNWLIAGCRQWQDEGLAAPETIATATESYRQEMDQLGAFLAERCAVGADAYALAHDLFGAYRSWCDATNEKMQTANWFGRQLTDRGFDRGQMPGGKRERIWLGVRLLDEGEAPQTGTQYCVPNTNTDIFEIEKSRKEGKAGDAVPNTLLCSTQAGLDLDEEAF